MMLLASVAQAQNNTCPTPSKPDVTTWHNDNCRTGWQQNEAILTPAALRNNLFGLVGQLSLAGSVDAEPLAVSGLGSIAGCTGNCSLVFVADEEDDVYAFDASDGAQVWVRNVAGEVNGTYVDCSINNLAGSFPPCEENTPAGNTVGIMGTPVIDGDKQTLYAVGSVNVPSDPMPQYWLFALDILSGEVTASTQIQGVVPGDVTPQAANCSSTYPGNGGLVSFDAGHIQRAALLLLNGIVYVAFSPGDGERENGWVFGYQYNPPFQQTAIFATTPYGTGGGIWGSGAGPASDGTYIYTVTGNGTFDLGLSGDPVDRGDSALKLLPPSNSGDSFPVIDFYDPPDNLTYQPPQKSKGPGRCINDSDFGSGGIMLFPEPFYYDENLGNVNMSVNADKESNIYVIDRDDMRPTGTNGNAVEIFGPFPQIPPSDPTQGYWNSPAYWKYWDSNNVAHYFLYYAASDGAGYPAATPLQIYQFALQTSGGAGPLSSSYATPTQDFFCHYSPTPSVSSTNQGDGAVAGTGVLWAIEGHRNQGNPTDCTGTDNGSALHAYDATTLEELYNSATSGVTLQYNAKFNVPMVFQGRVYMGPDGGNEVYVFGLCPETGCVQPQ